MVWKYFVRAVILPLATEVRWLKHNHEENVMFIIRIIIIQELMNETVKWAVLS